MSAIVWQFEHSLALSFFGIGMKTDLFQSCGHCWVFQICWLIECSTFTASSFRIWNSSTRIPSPPLSLFIVMLPKAHLTSHSRMSGSRWVITHHRDYLGCEDLFCIVLYILATYSFFFPHLFLLVGGSLLYSIVVVFAIHWHESAMDLHVFPIPIPPPTSLSTWWNWSPLYRVK